MTEELQNNVTVKHNKFVGAAGKPASQTTLLVREPSLDQKRKLKEHENKRTYTITQPEFDQISGDQAMKYKAGYRRVQFMPTEYQFHYGWKSNSSSPLLEAAQNIKEKKKMDEGSSQKSHNLNQKRSGKENREQPQVKFKTKKLQKKYNKEMEVIDTTPVTETIDKASLNDDPHTITHHDSHIPSQDTAVPKDDQTTKSRKRSPTYPFITEYQANFNPKYWTEEQRMSLAEQLKYQEVEKEEMSQVKDLIYGNCSYSKAPQVKNNTTTKVTIPTSTQTNAINTDNITTKFARGTEYSANYVSPVQLKYVDGAWHGAPQPDLLVYPPKPILTTFTKSSQDQETINVPSSVGSSWYDQVLELREKAREYKQRGEGSYFEMIEKLKQQNLDGSSLSVSSLSSSSVSHDSDMAAQENDVVVEDIDCSNESVCSSDSSQDDEVSDMESKVPVAANDVTTLTKSKQQQTHHFNEPLQTHTPQITSSYKTGHKPVLIYGKPKPSTNKSTPRPTPVYTTPHSTAVYTTKPTSHSTAVYITKPTPHSTAVYTTKPTSHSTAVYITKPTPRPTPVYTTPHSTAVYTTKPTPHSTAVYTTKSTPHSTAKPTPYPTADAAKWSTPYTSDVYTPKSIPHPKPPPTKTMLPICSTCGCINPSISCCKTCTIPKCDILTKPCSTCNYVRPPTIKSPPIVPTPPSDNSPDCELCRSALNQFKAKRSTQLTTPINKQTPSISDKPSRGTPTANNVLSHSSRYPSRQDDSFSVSPVSVSSNCSVISDILEKAQKRKDFWSKTAKE